MLAVSPTVEWGGFYSGDRRRLALNLDVRVRPGIIFYSSAEWNKVDLAEERLPDHGSIEASSKRSSAHGCRLVNNVQFDTQSAHPRLAVAVPLDSQAGQRSLLRLSAQLAGRPAAGPLRDAGPPRFVKAALHAQILIGQPLAPSGRRHYSIRAGWSTKMRPLSARDGNGHPHAR